MEPPPRTLSELPCGWTGAGTVQVMWAVMSRGKWGCWPRWPLGHRLLAFLAYPTGGEKEIRAGTGMMDLVTLKVLAP